MPRDSLRVLTLFFLFSLEPDWYVKLAVVLSGIEGVRTTHFRLTHPLVINPPLGVL